jgi:ribosomal protein L7Ae-like RNA K-turn-binding protein
MKKFAVLLALTPAFMGCESEIQTTSGREYLTKYQNVPVASLPTSAAPGEAINIDQKIREVAAVRSEEHTSELQSL